MKHIFVLNPAAGKNGAAEALVPEIEAIFRERGEEPELYRTVSVGDATHFVRERCAASPEEELRFYSCGGDGTMNEILQGLYGFPNAALGVVPCGSGNDFIRSFPELDFKDLRAQVEAEDHRIDLLRFNGTYSANLCSAGMDSDVCRLMTRFKRLPLVTGSGAYILALICVFFGHLGKKAHIELDDGRVLEENVLLLVMSNGGYYGGGWLSAPKFNVEDGLLDLCLIRKISRLKMARIIGRYKKGLHVEDPIFRDIVFYTHTKKLRVVFDRPTTLNADGQITESTTVEVEVLPRALRLICPKAKR